MYKLQQEDTVSADRKERIIFDPSTGKSRKVSSVVSRQNFNNAKYGNRNAPIQDVTGTEADVKKEETKLTSKDLAEEIVKKSLSRIAIDKNLGVKEVPFDGPYTKTPDVVVDKSGAKHTPYSRVRSLARQALAKQVKEEAEFEFEVIQEGTDYNVTITHYVKGEDGNRTSTKHDYVIKNALSRKHAKNIAMNKHSDKVGPLKPGHSFGTDSFATKELTKEEVEQLEESSVRTRDGDIVKAGDDVGYKDGYEKYGKVHKIQGDIVHIKSWDSDRGEHFIHTKHKSQIWKEEAEYISESPIEKTPRKFSGMHDKVEAPGMRTQAEKAALKAAAKRINDRSKQQANEETDMSDKLTYAQFVEQLLEYTPGPGGVTRVQGRSYGAQYHDPEGDDDADDKAKPAAAAPAVKRGRGRPAGSKSGANVKRLSSKGSNGYGYDSTGYKLHLPNSNK